MQHPVAALLPYTSVSLLRERDLLFLDHRVNIGFSLGDSKHFLYFWNAFLQGHDTGHTGATVWPGGAMLCFWYWNYDVIGVCAWRFRGIVRHHYY